MADLTRAITHNLKAFSSFVESEAGQDLVEYGLLAALIAIVAVVAVTTVGQQINVVLWQAIVQNF